MVTKKQRIWQTLMEEGVDEYSGRELADMHETSERYALQCRSEFLDQQPGDRGEHECACGQGFETAKALAGHRSSCDAVPDDGGGEAASEPPEPDPDPEPSEVNEPEPEDGAANLPVPAADAERATDGGGVQAASANDEAASEPNTGSSGVDAVQVGHEGSEKLSPGDDPSDDETPIEPPDSVDLNGIGAAELDADTGPVSEGDDAGVSEQEHRDGEAEQGSEDGGGLLGGLLGGGSDDPEDVVEEADDPGERQRRADVLDRLDEQATGGGGSSDPGAGTQTTSGDVVVDTELASMLFKQPFSMADNFSEWDGWALSDEEAQANARLFVAWCDANGIDPSEGTMLALSLSSTVGGRVAGYTAWRKREGGAASEPEPEDGSANEASEPATTEAGAEQTTEQATAGASDGFDPTEPIA